MVVGSMLRALPCFTARPAGECDQPHLPAIRHFNSVAEEAASHSPPGV